MNIRAKKDAIIVAKMRNGDVISGRVVSVDDEELVLKRQSYVYKGTIPKVGYVYCKDLEDILVDTPRAPESHYDVGEVVEWTYFGIERRESYITRAVISYDVCIANDY